MTPKAYRTLTKLRRSQISPGSLLYVDFEDSYISPVADEEDLAPVRKSKQRIKFRDSYDTMQEIFLYLSEKGYIRSDAPDWSYVTVTHAGNHIVFEYLSAFVSFLFRSVLVPIAVSAATALVVHLISDWFFPSLTSL